MTVAILGGTKFFGKHLLKLLNSNPSYKVDVYSHDKNCSFQIDRTNPADLEKVFSQKYDIIIDNICFGSSDALIINEYFNRNKALLPKQYVFTSTSFVYKSLNYIQPYDESIEFVFEKISYSRYPQIDYALGKQESEYIFANGILSDRLLIIRPPYIIGTEDHTNRLTKMISLAQNNYEITINKNDLHSMSFVDVSLLSSVVIRLIEQSQFGIFNIANDSFINNKEIYSIILKNLNKKSVFKTTFNNELLHPYSLEQELCLNLDKLRKIYNHDIHSIEKSFESIIKEILEKN